MQPGNETAAVDFLAAAGSVRESDDVGPVLAKTGSKGEAFRVVGEGDEPGLPIRIVAHQDRQLAV